MISEIYDKPHQGKGERGLEKLTNSLAKTNKIPQSSENTH